MTRVRPIKLSILLYMSVLQACKYYLYLHFSVAAVLKSKTLPKSKNPLLAQYMSISIEDRTVEWIAVGHDQLHLEMGMILIHDLSYLGNSFIPVKISSIGLGTYLRPTVIQATYPLTYSR